MPSVPLLVLWRSEVSSVPSQLPLASEDEWVSLHERRNEPKPLGAWERIIGRPSYGRPQRPERHRAGFRLVRRAWQDRSR
jgi:hypothetical protein